MKQLTFIFAYQCYSTGLDHYVKSLMVCLECEKWAKVSLVEESKHQHYSLTNLQPTKTKGLVLIGDFE